MATGASDSAAGDAAEAEAYPDPHPMQAADLPEAAAAAAGIDADGCVRRYVAVYRIPRAWNGTCPRVSGRPSLSPSSVICVFVTHVPATVYR